MSNTEYLVAFWETVKEYIPSKDRQTAADHVINELIELGLDDHDLIELAVDKAMIDAIKEHVDIDSDEEPED